MSRIAIIPARGGSKRIPRKNIIDLGGRPMISWTIQAALESKCFDAVLVSTDCEEIAKISIAEGADAPFLREDSADDLAPVSQATIGALKQAEAHWKIRFDQVVQLMPNCPLRKSNHIREAIESFERRGSAPQISGFRFGWMNPWWAMRLDENGAPSPMFPEAMTKRSQELPHLYCPSGAVWISSRENLLSAGTFYGPGYRLHPMEWEAAMDIDDMDDFRMAQALMRKEKSL